MIKETIEKNETIKVNTKEIEVLKKYFPSCFDKEGTFDIKTFEELIKKEEVDIKKEGYALDFLGKSYARYLSSLDSETVIVPDEENKNTSSENIYIVGDNLDALQHLKYSYSESIKCIYIDPPYNTGSDGFVYNDKFSFTAEGLAKKINIEEDEAQRILDMQGRSTHSAWLTFMYPRLELAKELLSEDGVIFISIDDNEQANLKLLCDSVFGEQNFIGKFIKQSKVGGGSDTKFIVKEHEYCICYAKNINLTEEFYIEHDNEYLKRYSEVDDTGRYFWDTFARPGLKNPIIYGIIAPDGSTITNGWIRSQERFHEEYSKGIIRIIKKPNDEWSVQFKQYLNISGKKPRSMTMNFGGTIEGKNEVKKLFKNDKIFSYPKSVVFIKELLKTCTSKNDLILDFFSGSATTAHAVMQQNLEDGGNRKYIMVQLDEQVKKGSEAEQAGYKTIDEIGRERIRRAAEQIKKDEPEKSKGLDLGFKTYFLKQTDSKTLDKLLDFNPYMPLDVEDIQKTFGIGTILETWKIKDGFGFNAKVANIDLEGYTAFKVSDNKIGNYLYLLNEMEGDSIKELIRKIEAFEINVDKIIQYGYSFSYNSNTALKANLKTLKNKKAIDVLIRY